MKIAIPTKESGSDAAYNPRFGRSPYFYIVDPETGEGESFPNPSVNADSGAGVQAAQFIAGQGATVVISNSFGPKAYQTLNAARIQMFLAPESENTSILDVLTKYREGQLTEAEGPTNRGGH